MPPAFRVRAVGSSPPAEARRRDALPRLPRRHSHLLPRPAHRLVGRQVRSRPPSPISSQVACRNHLEPAREQHDLALTLAHNVQPDAQTVIPIEGGYLAYEWIGEHSYLGERGWSATGRGKHATSLDALMAIRAGRRQHAAARDRVEVHGGAIQPTSRSRPRAEAPPASRFTGRYSSTLTAQSS